MSTPTESREEAIKRLNDRASELAEATAPKTSEHLTAQSVSSEAYKIVAELLGGVFIGLGLGFGVDRLFGTNPWGLIGGVLLGFALSIYMARRTANRLMAQAKASGIEPKSIPFDDEEDEDR
ncbi:MAG: F0F1 ATP synthase assembly protein I [Brevundimonas sp.]|uniref:AtpZ/AtpI family protein n=1 Tax=Brevundimonas sp. TaxID=1871086 RepID=UPI000DB2BCA0|nr:AtpZ/AtpI family protein [Brevundimonas sp.]MBN9465440.1 AtpZ/AtpI family protein [Brevundimonas sp.]PZU74911.1 MAG: F0F1 ATP synthase assembly protein I [Brevundimonas sp.]